MQKIDFCEQNVIETGLKGNILRGCVCVCTCISVECAVCVRLCSFIWANYTNAGKHIDSLSALLQEAFNAPSGSG